MRYGVEERYRAVKSNLQFARITERRKIRNMLTFERQTYLSPRYDRAVLARTMASLEKPAAKNCIPTKKVARCKTVE